MAEPNPHTPTGRASRIGEHHDLGDRSLSDRLNALRAGVLGANDGIVSTAGLVMGVAAATPDRGPIFTAGIAGLVAGALSMAVGEFVSVSTQRDTERALLAKETRELSEAPEFELRELTDIYVGKGLSPDLAHQVAVELTERDALAAHADAELGIDPDDLTNPWHAAWASMLAFSLGALLPLLAVLLPPQSWRIPVLFVAVLVALAGTGQLSARLGRARALPAVTRVVAGGALAMAVTFAIGRAFGTAVG